MRASDKELLIASILYTLYKSFNDERNTYGSPVSDRMLIDINDKYAKEGEIREILSEIVEKGWVEEIDFGAGTGRLFYRIKSLGEEKYEEQEAVAY